jgi:ankyrin repeat protein
MDDRDQVKDYIRAMALLTSGSADDWEALSVRFEGFPHGTDAIVQRRWIINAAGGGSKSCVAWMIAKGVDLDFCDDEGYTPVHAVLERTDADRNPILELLLDGGAPINRKGVNDWTPAHMAAARDDVEALRILVRHGADLSIRTAIDDYATPVEEARHLGMTNAVKYLESVR